MSEYYIDINSPGVISGWVSPNEDGSPAVIRARHSKIKHLEPFVFCSNQRPDVERSGKSLFSGFHVNVSSDFEAEGFEVEVNGDLFFLEKNEWKPINLHVDSHEGGKITGWVDSPEPPHSMVICSNNEIVYASFYERSDISAMKGEKFRMSGFVAEEEGPLNIKWIIINNSYIHFIEGDS